MQHQCAHCGELTTHEQFCCNGCKMVYELLQENGLCTYYQLNDKPGVAQRMKVRLLRQHIEDFMCRYETVWQKKVTACDAIMEELQRLQ